MTTATTNNPKSRTAILCELTRLKSQQKYLECGQIKLNPENFDEFNEGGGDADSVKQTVREIVNLEEQLAGQLASFEDGAKRDIHDMWMAVDEIRHDVSKEEHLAKLSVNGMRERIIEIVARLDKLNDKNKQCFASLRADYEKLMRDTNILFK